MPSSNNVETMFVQHYLEKGPAAVGMWQLATSRQLCRNRDKFGLILLPDQYITTGVWKWRCLYRDHQDGDDAASHPTRQRIKTATMPQVVLPDDESSRQ
jgi:hypothetical protein